MNPTYIGRKPWYSGLTSNELNWRWRDQHRLEVRAGVGEAARRIWNSYGRPYPRHWRFYLREIRDVYFGVADPKLRAKLTQGLYDIQCCWCEEAGRLAEVQRRRLARARSVVPGIFPWRLKVAYPKRRSREKIERAQRGLERLEKDYQARCDVAMMFSTSEAETGNPDPGPSKEDTAEAKPSLA
jgi:hypothetical protein